MKIWTYTETSVSDCGIDTDVKLFKNEVDIKEYFNKKKDEEMKIIKSWNKEIFEDIQECNDGDICLHTNTDTNFGYCECGYENECNFFMRIEEKEVE